MSNADIKLCFKMIDLESAKYEVFKNDGGYILANNVLHARRGMQQMLAALLNVPVERLEEIRKIR